MSTQVFDISQKLFENSLNDRAIDYGQFVHVKSRFFDEWYNLITPKVGVDEFDFDKAEKVIFEEKKNGFSVSFYIHNDMKNRYEEELANRGYRDIGDDVYTVVDMTKKYELIDMEFEEVNGQNYQEYEDLAAVCFPDWANSREFSRLCYDLSLRENDERIFKNVVIKKDKKIVSVGSILVSPKLKWGYLHNVGTDPEYRRQGLFSELNKYLCNMAFEKGANNIFALVEDKSMSFYGYEKMGFEKREKYWMYNKS